MKTIRVLVLLLLAAFPACLEAAPGTVHAVLPKIAHGSGGLALADADRFGISCAVLGDVDGDGVPELTVGADSDDTGGDGRGAVHILF